MENFKNFCKLYGIELEDIEKAIKELSPYFPEEVKEKICSKTFEFIEKNFPNSYKESKNKLEVLPKVFKTVLNTILNSSNNFCVCIERIARKHTSDSKLSSIEFIKDLEEFIKLILTEAKIPPHQIENFKKLALFLTLILTFIASRYFENLEEKSELDPVTKLPSKNKLISNTKNLLKKAKTIVLIDIESFKEYNLYYSYNSGNSILSAFASILQLSFPNDYVTRLQNDEFVIVTELSVENVEKKLTEIQKRLEENPITIVAPGGLEKIKLTFNSILLDTRINKDLNFDDLMWILYNSLQNATDKFIEKTHIITRDELEKLLDKKKLALDLLSALNHNNLKLAWQKVVNIFTGETLFREILARVIFPSGELVSPGRFINVIAGSTVEKKLDRLVIKKLFSSIKEGIINERISVNISKPFLRDDFYWLLKQMDYYRINPEMLTIELTERKDFLTLKAVREKIKELRNRNVSIFIDDYGVKFSNYDLTKEINPDGLKIDGSIIMNLESNLLDEIFVNGVLQMAKRATIRIVAEYIETEEQLSKLKEIAENNDFKYVFGQGYYWEKPQLIC